MHSTENISNRYRYTIPNKFLIDNEDELRVQLKLFITHVFFMNFFHLEKTLKF